MASTSNKVHVLPTKLAASVFDRKYMAGAKFMADAPCCPQCGSKTFTLYGCAISGLRKVYENGRAAPTTVNDVMLRDCELFWPDELECKRCNTITHFQ